MKPITVFLMVFLLSCNGIHAPKLITSVYLLVDQTGDALALPSAESIYKLYDLRKRTERGAIFTLQSISDLEYAPSVTFSLDPQPFLLQNVGRRKKDINDFLSKISLSIAQVSLQPVGKSRSQIYAPLIQTLNTISAQDVDEKIVLVMSDLEENSSFSVYDNADLKLLLDNPDAVTKRLSQYGALGDMHNISVQFSYNASDYKDSQRYSLMASYFKRLIESKGGHVVITGGSLTN
jgi:hypothetical protein